MPTAGEPQRFLGMTRAGHRFAFRYQPGSEMALLRVFASLAEDPETPFDAFDAAVLAYQMGWYIGGPTVLAQQELYGA